MLIRTATNFYVITTCLVLHLPTSSGTVVVTVVVVPVVSVGGAGVVVVPLLAAPQYVFKEKIKIEIYQNRFIHRLKR